MPSLTSNAAALRGGGFNFTGFLSTIPQTVVLAGTVSATPTLPTLTIAYTLTAGDHNDVRTGMTVHLYSSSGARKAVLRVATGGTITNVSLPINEVSQGTANIVSGDTFQVIDEWRITDKLVSATAALNKDSRIAYSDQGSNPNPVTNSGGPYAGENDTVVFTGSTSFVVDPDSASVTHSWDLVDGTPNSSTSTSPTSVFPIGFRWVSHTTTDNTSSKTTTQRVPVWVHGDGYEALSVQVESLSASVDTGWRCTFKLPVGSEGAITNLPDGALVVYWERENYNGTEGSYGSNVSGRSHIKFAGYLVSDSINITPETNEVTFEAVSPLAILDQTPALPQLMVNKSSPARWSEVKTLTTKKMFWYLANWGSNLLDAWDFVWNDGLDLGFTRVSVDGDTIGAQLRDIANSLNVQVTCDRLGRILFTRDPDFLTSGERSARTKTYDLTAADVMAIDVTRNHRGTVKSVRGEGITPTNKAVFSNGAGNAPAPFGTGSETLSKQIVATQALLNERAGYHFAKVNALYNGRFVERGARLTLPDGYDVFDPALREFVTLTLPATLNTRAVGWDNTTRWTIENVDINYEAETGAKNVSITLNHETTGPAGTTYVPPPEASNAIPTFPPIDIQFPDLPIDLGVDIDGNVVIPPGTTSGGYVAAWSEDTSWLVENALTLAEPPFGVNTPAITGEVTDLQWVHLGHPGAYLIENDGTDSTFWYSATFPDAGATWVSTNITGVYTKIRVGSTAGKVYILSAENESTDPCDDMVINTGKNADQVFLGEFSGKRRFQVNSGNLELWTGDPNTCCTFYGADDLSGSRRFDQSYYILCGDADLTENLVAPWPGPVVDVWLISAVILSHPYEVDIDVRATSSEVVTRYSDDFGATFDAAEEVGNLSGVLAGFDTAKVGDVVLVGVDGQVMKATNGGAYAAYGSALPAGFVPAAIWIPRYQFTSSTTLNNATNPEYLIASTVEDGDGETMYRVTAGGNTFTACSPDFGGKGLAVSSDSIAMSHRSGKHMSAILLFGSTRKLVTSTASGGSWLDRGGISGALSVRYRRGDTTNQQLYISSAGGVVVSQNHGALLQTRLSPGTVPLLGSEPFG